jgi:titin
MTAGTGTCSIAATKGADANYDEATSAPVSVTATPAASPAAPSALTATANSANQITLAWSDNSTGEDGFKIERSPTNQNNFVQVAAVNANATSYADTGLSPATKYYYRVRAYVTTASLDSPYSNAANATTLSAPAAPTTLSAAAASSSQINLTWTDKSTNETGFKISRSLDGTAFAPIATVGQNIRSYADTSGLTPDTTYFYVVQAFNANGDSKPSNTATTSTLPAPTPPPAPSGLVASAVSSSQISLLWTDDAANETGFKVERSTDGTTFAQVALLGANTTTYVDSGLTASTLYSYRVRATNASGDSQYSNTASATTLDAGATAPAAPGNLAALAQTGPSVSLTWTDNSNNEQGFAIERSLDGTTFAQLATVGPNVNTYSDTGLRGNTNYYYRVRASNGAGNSPYSNTASVRTRNK